MRKIKWSIVVPVLSLAAALVFNGLQVRSSAISQRQAKVATELSLLTQLQTVMSESVYRRGRYARQFRLLEDGRLAGLTPDAYKVTAEEAANMDYFAWLFNNGYLTADGADELWGPRMICEYKRAFAPALQNPAQDAPELVRFIQKRGRRLAKLAPHC